MSSKSRSYKVQRGGKNKEHSKENCVNLQICWSLVAVTGGVTTQPSNSGAIVIGGHLILLLFCLDDAGRGSASSRIEKAQSGGRPFCFCSQSGHNWGTPMKSGRWLAHLTGFSRRLWGESKINKYHVLREEYGVRGSAWTGVKISKGRGRSHWLSSWSDLSHDLVHARIRAGPCKHVWAR